MSLFAVDLKLSLLIDAIGLAAFDLGQVGELVLRRIGDFD
jgi:hypothetical protein